MKIYQPWHGLSFQALLLFWLLLHIKLMKYEFIVFINTKLLQIYFMNNFKVAVVLGCNGCSSSTT